VIEDVVGFGAELEANSLCEWKVSAQGGLPDVLYQLDR